MSHRQDADATRPLPSDFFLYIDLPFIGLRYGPGLKIMPASGRRKR